MYSINKDKDYIFLYKEKGNKQLLIDLCIFHKIGKIWKLLFIIYTQLHLIR